MLSTLHCTVFVFSDNYWSLTQILLHIQKVQTVALLAGRQGDRLHCSLNSPMEMQLPHLLYLQWKNYLLYYINVAIYQYPIFPLTCL